MRKFILLFIFLGSLHSFGQKFPFHKYHKWEKEPEQIDLNLTDPLYYYTKYLFAVEYKYDDYRGQYYKYSTIHYRVKLTTDYAIEDFNKVYIAMEDVLSIVNLDARLIKKDKVVELDPEVEEFYSEDEGEAYYYFPISGLELGDELELIYTLKKEPDFNGDQFFFQGEIPIYNFDFYFIAPNDSYFKFLAHNGLDEPVKVDTILQKNQWTIRMDSIPAFRSEYFCEYSNVTMKLDVSLRGFNKPSDKSFSPYDDFRVSLNYVYNRTYIKKERKALLELSEQLGISKTNSVEKKVRLIENYVKMEIASSSAMDLNTPMSEVISSQKSSTIGSILLFMALFQVNEIEYEYGFVSDRYETFFSDEIESMFFLQSYFIYIPKIDKYLAPLDFSSRLGYLKKNWVPNNGYYLTSSSYPLPKTKGKVKPVPYTPATDNTDSTVVFIQVNEDMTAVEMQIEVYLKGYPAGKKQCYYYLYSDEKRKKVGEEILNFMNDNSKFEISEITGVEPEDAFVNPLVVKGEVTLLASSLLEKADQLTIFKLGELFGQYVGVADIIKKKTDFVFGSAFISSTHIFIEFPEGVKITNTENVLTKEDNVRYEGITVEADLEINNNKLSYVQREEFHQIRYSIDNMDQMIAVFDFYNGLNKMNLVVEK